MHDTRLGSGHRRFRSNSHPTVADKKAGALTYAGRRRLYLLLTVALTALASSLALIPAASADPCPGVEVVFARGTFEAPGPGQTGQAFVDALRAHLPDESIDLYPVNYPASLDFPRAADGVADASTRVAAIAAQCPETQIVLGGYSQGAAVAAYTPADIVPPGYALPPGITGPLPPEIADHVAAVVLFGKPTQGFVHMLVQTAPPIAVGSRYADRTIDLCMAGDPVCSPDGFERSAHSAYRTAGMTTEAAQFAADRVRLRA